MAIPEEEMKNYKKHWWKPKSFWGWIFALFIILPLAIAAWPVTLPAVIIWFFLKQDKERRKKIVKFTGIGLGALLLLTIIGAILLPEELTKKGVNQEVSLTPMIKPTPIVESEECTLKAKVRFSSTKLEIDNLDARDWSNVLIEVNGSYKYEVSVIEAGKTYTVELASFANDKGERFNSFTHVVQNVFISDRSILCDYYAEVK